MKQTNKQTNKHIFRIEEKGRRDNLTKYTH